MLNPVRVKTAGRRSCLVFTYLKKMFKVIIPFFIPALLILCSCKGSDLPQPSSPSAIHPVTGDSAAVPVVPSKPDTAKKPQQQVGTSKREFVMFPGKKLAHIKQYLVFTPQGYDPKSAREWPLVFFLHGAGEKGNDITKVKRSAFPQLAISDGTDFPFIMISPQLAMEAGYWSPDELDVLFSEIVDTYKVDRSRVIVTGMSLGGNGTWDWAAHSPQYFAAALPICGWGNPSNACRMKGTEIWAFHGDSDLIVNITGTKNMISALRSCGLNPAFTIYPGVGHDSWTRTYNNPDVIKWMMAQRKNK